MSTPRRTRAFHVAGALAGSGLLVVLAGCSGSPAATTLDPTAKVKIEVWSGQADTAETVIEGLAKDHPVKRAWIKEQVPQCGYCQSGQIMQAASLLAKNSNPTKEEVVAHMDGNLCRCMTYSRIQKAIMRAASEMRTASNTATERSPT